MRSGTHIGQFLVKHIGKMAMRAGLKALFQAGVTSAVDESVHRDWWLE